MAKNSKTSEKLSPDLSQKAYLGIRQMLFHNQIVAGQKIPFGDLAEQMDMSITPVVQALKYLEFQGLVRREPNKGYFIEALKLEEVEELYKFRKMLELSLLEEAMQQLDQAGIAQLQASHNAYLESLAGNLTHQKIIADMNFHLTIAQLANQPIQLNALKNVFDVLHLKYKASLGYVSREQSNQADHGHILEAILKQDTELAKSLLSAHIENSRVYAYLNLKQMMNEKADFQF